MWEFLETLPGCAVLAESDGPGPPWACLSLSCESSVAACLSLCGQRGIAVVPGSPRALPPDFAFKAAAFVDLTPLAAVHEHRVEDQVVTVGAGMTLAELNRLLAESGQWLPLSGDGGNDTIGSIIGGGDGGCLEHGYGGPRNLVLGLEAALSSGDTVKCGGKVVKNVSGYDTARLFVGSRGWLGLVVRAHLRLFALPSSFLCLIVPRPTRAALFAAAGALLRSGLPLAVLEAAHSRLVGELAGRQGAAAAGALVVGLVGQEQVVEAVAAAAAAAAFPGSEPLSLRGQEALDLWSKMSARDSLPGHSSIECSLPPAEMEMLLALPGDAVWQARPSCGRLRLFPPHGEETALLAALERFAAARDAPLTVAYRGPGGADVVAFLPEGGAVLRSLKDRLKRRYDPHGCLNPLALP